MPFTPRRAACKASGFTLIEILIVVVIIGLMTALVTIAVGALGSDTEMDKEVTRLTDVMGVAIEQAQLEGRDYGLRLEPDGYQVMVFDGRRGWIDAAGDRWFERHEFPPGLSVELQEEGRRVLLRVPATPDTRVPQIVTYASGEVTPYRITLTRTPAGTSTSLDGAADGTIKLVGPDGS